MPETPNFARIAHDLVSASFAARFSHGQIDASDLLSVKLQRVAILDPDSLESHKDLVDMSFEEPQAVAIPTDAEPKKAADRLLVEARKLM
jgi:hypothetical protein